MRSDIYMEIIDEAIKRVLNFQDTRKGSLTEGCFFYPYWKNRKENYVNARWQEAVLSLSWYFNKFNNEDVWERIIKAIDFWCKLQQKNGAFPEFSRHDRSFSATAFSTLAVINSLNLINYSKERWLDKIKKSCNYLLKNDDLVFITNEMAASLALLKAGEYFHEPKYLKESERKLNLVLRSQTSKGFFNEINSFNLSKNSLILELLGQYYLNTKDKRILDSATNFINLFLNIDLKLYRKYKKADWIIVDGFEIFSNEIINGKEALKKALNNFDIQHLEYESNFYTELYRLCHANDNSKEDIEHIELKTDLNTNMGLYYARPNKLLNFIRPFGIHKFLRIRYRFL